MLRLKPSYKYFLNPACYLSRHEMDPAEEEITGRRWAEHYRILQCNISSIHVLNASQVRVTYLHRIIFLCQNTSIIHFFSQSLLLRDSSKGFATAEQSSVLENICYCGRKYCCSFPFKCSPYNIRKNVDLGSWFWLLFIHLPLTRAGRKGINGTIKCCYNGTMVSNVCINRENLTNLPPPPTLSCRHKVKINFIP